MLTFNLKKEWFDKIKTGEKTHEYREVKPYWTKRILKYFKILDANFELFEFGYPVWIKDKEICFVLGYTKTKLYAKVLFIKKVNGKNTDLKIDKPVYDIEFEVIK